MDNLHDLKNIWLTAKTDILPPAEEVVRMGKKFRDQRIRRKLAVIIIASVESLLVVWVMFTIHAKLPATYIGLTLIIASCVVLVATNIKSIKRFYDMEDYNNHDLILFLERTKQNQLLFYKKTQLLSMLLASVGSLLYLYELFARHKSLLTWGYAITLVYFAVLWLFVRPRVFKKQRRKIDEMITQLEKISKQFENEN